MNIASPELCLELYRLSGLLHTAWAYEMELGQRGMRAVAVRPNADRYEIAEWLFKPDPINKSAAAYCPAYDLGYLLRILPNVDLTHLKGYEWRVSLTNSEGCYGRTPEDAACKLVIRLLKDGLIHIK